MKKNINELREILIGREMSFMLLDNMMYTKGYYTVLDSGVTKDIKNDLNIIYTAIDTGKAEIQIHFEITIDNAPDVIEEAFYLRVLEIEEY